MALTVVEVAVALIVGEAVGVEGEAEADGEAAAAGDRRPYVMRATTDGRDEVEEAEDEEEEEADAEEAAALCDISRRVSE